LVKVDDTFEVDCIKIKIESAKVKVLQGAKRTLKIAKNLIIEVLGKEKGEQCEKILGESGFKINIISKHDDNHYWIFATRAEK